jgi:hypothetical protein
MSKRFSKSGIPYEADEQKAYFNWVDINAESDWRYKMIFHCPNGAHLARGAATYFFLKTIGLKKGFPDVGILLPSKLGAALFIELKRKGQGLSPEQEDWRELLHKAGYAWALARNFDEAREITLEWFSNLSPKLTGGIWTRSQNLLESKKKKNQHQLA